MPYWQEHKPQPVQAILLSFASVLDCEKPIFPFGLRLGILVLSGYYPGIASMLFAFNERMRHAKNVAYARLLPDKFAT